MTTKIFSDDDQRRFAAISGDYNPIHLDALAARRLVAGRPVVHGTHLVLAAIERWTAGNPDQIGALKCSFQNPVAVGDRVMFAHHVDSRGRIVINATVRDVVCAKLSVTPESQPVTKPSINISGAEVVRRLDAPADQEPATHLGKAYAVAIDRGIAADFPGASAAIGDGAVSALAAASYFVGMICPGLHSMMSSIDVVIERNTVDQELFAVSSYRENVRLVDIDCAGPITGRIQAFRRPAPARQMSMADVAAHIKPDEFNGSRSLIIGGSRGLGELTAKMLATGGGDVVITYRSGKNDADRVAGEINQYGGRCEARRFDVERDSPAALGADAASFDAIYFFPTPRIFRKGGGVFDQEWFEEFARVYVTAFHALCAHVEEHATRPVRVFFPSSIAVDNRPKGLTEYAMAKSAAEQLIADINRTFTRVSVVSRRLPRLTTDQTATILDVPAESNIDTLLPIVRSLYG